MKASSSPPNKCMTPTSQLLLSSQSPSPQMLYALPSESHPEDGHRAIAAAAAAAARRKRRKALVRRSLKDRQKRIKIGHPPITEISKRPLAEFASSRRTVIQPTVFGMEELVSILLRGESVAVPTECTYEVVTQLNWKEPQLWRDRIKTLADAELSANSYLTTQGSAMSSSFRPISAVGLINDCNTLGLEVDSARSPGVSGNAPSVVPHVYIHPTAVDGPFWREHFPKRPFAVRNKDGDVLAAHAFSETQQVLKILANKIWPGPLLINVAMDQSFPEELLIRRHGRCYLSLRSLCHPLTVKVHQEYQSRSSTNAMLVGWALRQTPGQLSSAFVTESRQVQVGMAVLNGEERQEIFAVPTCEYGEPCPTSVWLDSSRRLVVLSCNGGTPFVSADQLLQLIRNRKTPKSDRERVIHAVLNRWKVVVEGDFEE